MNRILNVNPNIEITSARKIVDTRNRISHGYNSVSDDIIWAIGIFKNLDVIIYIGYMEGTVDFSQY